MMCDSSKVVDWFDNWMERAKRGENMLEREGVNDEKATDDVNRKRRLERASVGSNALAKRR